MIIDFLFAAGFTKGVVNAARVEPIVVVVSRVPSVDKHLLANMVVKHRRLTIRVIGCFKVKCLEMVTHPYEEWIVWFNIYS